jgi:hypothetical protein
MDKQMPDAMLDDNYDLAISSSDIQISESTARHQQMLLVSNKGDYKQYPIIGVGAATYLNDERYQALIRAINIEFAKDSMDVTDIRLNSSGTITSIAGYK